MKKIAVFTGLLVMLATQVYATPTLLNLNGLKSVDGATLYGSVIYDPDKNQVLGENEGFMYEAGKLPSYLPGTSPTTWVELEPGVKLGFRVVPILGNIKVADVSGGVMPLYFLGTDKAFSASDLSWAGKWAIRVNQQECQGCTMNIDVAPGYLYTLPQYQQKPGVVQVPEASTFWYALSGIGIGVLSLWPRKKVVNLDFSLGMILGLAIGLAVAGGSVYAYTWDMNRSPSDNLNRSEESQQQQEMLNLQRENNRILQEHRSPC